MHENLSSNLGTPNFNDRVPLDLVRGILRKTQAAGLACLLVACGVGPSHGTARPPVRAEGNAGSPVAAMPRYDHIFLIVDENKTYEQIVDAKAAPGITKLAHRYGLATRYFAVTHPSQPNYVAIVGGSTHGIRDDAHHVVDAPNLATQLQGAHLSWKDYLESIPQPGSLADYAGPYAAKHSGFVQYASVRNDPNRAQHLVGFDVLERDLRAGRVPNFAMIAPNLCNDMHGQAKLFGAKCFADLIETGDGEIVKLVGEIQSSPVWREKGNVAVVLTWDEDDAGSTAGCCGNDASDPANRGGGHVATIVITNHGRRGVVDAAPYSHYSLLRTIEDGLGIRTHLGRAAAPGVHDMTPLFAVR